MIIFQRWLPDFFSCAIVVVGDWTWYIMVVGILLREGTHSIGVATLREEVGLKLYLLSESSDTYLVCTLPKKYGCKCRRHETNEYVLHCK